MYEDVSGETPTSCRCATNAGRETREHLLDCGTRDREENMDTRIALAYGIFFLSDGDVQRSGFCRNHVCVPSVLND